MLYIYVQSVAQHMFSTLLNQIHYIGGLSFSSGVTCAITANNSGSTGKICSLLGFINQSLGTGGHDKVEKLYTFIR